MKAFDDLEARGLIKQTTNADKVRALLNGKKRQTFYIGFDPTADSLHVGHLLQIITAKRLVDAGHDALMLIGGATAMIGDPTGKTQMRKVLSLEETLRNSMAISRQILKIIGVPLSPEGLVLSSDKPLSVLCPNNIGWFKDISWMEILQEVGRHFSVNNMLRAECFKSRMEAGLSFLEFNYMIMQAYDFHLLHKEMGCALQIGGDDQWSNMLAGVDLIHKKTGDEAFALTLPLLTNSDGTKMGKTEKGAVWLDPNKTSPFEFFQFWRNIPDDKVKDCINFFTWSDPVAHTEGMMNNINWAKKFLASEVTTLVHGKKEAAQALEQAEALFEKQDTSAMEAISVAEGIHILDLVIKCKFAKSRTDARNLIANRGITINGEVQDNPTINISKSVFGNELILKKGKKHFCRLIIEDK